MDVHCEYAPDYVRKLRRGARAHRRRQRRRRAAREGARRSSSARCAPRSRARSASAARRYRSAEAEGFVDTVFLGAFRRRVFETSACGIRARSPTRTPSSTSASSTPAARSTCRSDIVVHYFPRDSFKTLAKQYFKYGRGRARTLLKLGQFPTMRPLPAVPHGRRRRGAARAPAALAARARRVRDYALATGAEAVRVGSKLGLARDPDGLGDLPGRCTSRTASASRPASSSTCASRTGPPSPSASRRASRTCARSAREDLPSDRDVARRCRSELGPLTIRVMRRRASDGHIVRERSPDDPGWSHGIGTTAVSERWPCRNDGGVGTTAVSERWPCRNDGGVGTMAVSERWPCRAERARSHYPGWSEGHRTDGGVVRSARVRDQNQEIGVGGSSRRGGWCGQARQTAVRRASRQRFAARLSKPVGHRNRGAMAQWAVVHRRHHPPRPAASSVRPVCVPRRRFRSSRWSFPVVRMYLNCTCVPGAAPHPILPVQKNIGENQFTARATRQIVMARPRKRHRPGKLRFGDRAAASVGAAGRPPKGPRSSERHKKREAFRKQRAGARRLARPRGSRRAANGDLLSRASQGARHHVQARRLPHRARQHPEHARSPDRRGRASDRALEGDAGVPDLGREASEPAISKRRKKRRRGTVFVDRYHAKIIRSPRQARNALAYVLNNWRKHREDRQLGRRRLDPRSVLERGPLRWLAGLQAARLREDYEPLPVWGPRCWLLNEGWRKHGLIGTTEIPSQRLEVAAE